MNQNTKLILIAAGFALILLTIVICAICISRSLRRSRENTHGRNVEKLNQAVSASMRQIAELSGALDARMEALTRANDQKLDEMRRMVGEKLEGRLTESFRVVNGQLADVHKGIGEMRELAANVTDLKKVLGNVKTRGVWGEVLLKNILAEMFAPSQYSENAAIPASSEINSTVKPPDAPAATTMESNKARESAQQNGSRTIPDSIRRKLAMRDFIYRR